MTVLIQKSAHESIVSHSFIEISRLTVSYRRAAAVEDVSLSIPFGEITAIIGPSGCGKTSLLMAINRLTDLIPECTIKGQVKIASLNIYDPDTEISALRRKVGMVFQKPNPFPLSIRRNLELPLLEIGVTDREVLSHRMEAVLKNVGLWNDVKDRLSRSALSLSGGQQQRLCIARALTLNPNVLLMDEPCSALDPYSSAVVEDLITSFKGRYTVLIVTHNLSQAKRIADRTAFFWMVDGAGRLMEEGPTPQIFRAPRHELTAAYVNGIRG